MTPASFKTESKMSKSLLANDKVSTDGRRDDVVKSPSWSNSLYFWFVVILVSSVFSGLTCFFYVTLTKYESIELRAAERNMIAEQLRLLMELNVEFNQELTELQREEHELQKDLIEVQKDLSKMRMETEQCVKIPVEQRFDCHPEDEASEQSCNTRGCCWNPLGSGQTIGKLSKVPLNTPYCYYPKDWRVYRLVNKTQKGNDYTGFQRNYISSVYPKDIKLMRIDATSSSKTILRVKISDAEHARYEPELPIRPDPRPFESNEIEANDYLFETEDSSPGFRVRRTSDKTAIFDSIGHGGLIFADQFLQISTVLPTSNLYGLGDHRASFRLNMNWQILTMFNKDQPRMENANLYGSHPFYLVIEESGNCHGVLFLNSNAMDVILQPTPALTFRSIGGVFDMYFFMGPTPADVVRQYSEVVGKPFMPPYWSLGFHLCRFGYGSLEKTKEVWQRTRAAGIPFDTQWNDLDYMLNNNDFTYDTDAFKGLPEFLKEIAAEGMHYIPLIDAGISASEPNGSYAPFDEGIRRGIFVKEATSDLPFKGKVWNRGLTVWPDFTNPETASYWHDMMNIMWHMFPYDGAWIDMNEPSNFYNGHVDGCVSNNLDNPPYVPNVIGNLLATKTLCMNAKLYKGSHYDLHNSYGMSEAIATNRALSEIRGRRPFVISRSSWVGLGKYAGHWSGDNFATWHDMRMSIPELLSFSLFQIPMMGSDICGFNGNTTESLCNRWMQLGAFYPFSRNHNSDDAIEQDPVAMGDLVVKSSRKALMIRYRLLPYLYTLFYSAHKYGETVARPLFFEFPDDSATYGIDTQFLWGSSLMILPVLEEGATSVTAYLPRGIWYDFYSKKPTVSNGGNYTFEAPLDTIPLLLRGGSIIPAQSPNRTTTASRKNHYQLLISPDEDGTAKGKMYWDDGDSLTGTKNNLRWKFTLENQMVTSRLITTPAEPNNYADVKFTLGLIQVTGVVKNVTEVSIDGKKVEFKYEKDRSYLLVKGFEADLTKEFTFSWR